MHFTPDVNESVHQDLLGHLMLGYSEKKRCCHMSPRQDGQDCCSVWLCAAVRGDATMNIKRVHHSLPLFCLMDTVSLL